MRKARKEYHGGRTINGNETKTLLAHCKYYHMVANPRQNIQDKYFHKTFSLKVLLSTDFHILMRTAAKDIIEECSTKISMTVPMFSKACREYHGN